MNRIAIPALRSHIDTLYQATSAQLAQAIAAAQNASTAGNVGSMLAGGVKVLRDALLVVVKVESSCVRPSSSIEAGKEVDLMEFIRGLCTILINLSE